MKREEKELWGPGPWVSEPDHEVWEHRGLLCIVVRGPMGSLNGYVGLPEGHPGYGKDGYGIDVDVHGGLTYASRYRPDGGPAEGKWYVGFDTSHCYDFAPKHTVDLGRLGIPMGRDPEVQYRTFGYVLAETESLAEQLQGGAK